MRQHFENSASSLAGAKLGTFLMEKTLLVDILPGLVLEGYKQANFLEITIFGHSSFWQYGAAVCAVTPITPKPDTSHRGWGQATTMCVHKKSW